MAFNDHDDLNYALLRAHGLPSQSVNGTVTGTGVNLGNGGAAVLACISVGSVASGGSGTIKLQSSRNDNTASADAAADAYADITDATVDIDGTDANTIVYIKTDLREEKFVRVHATTDDAIQVSVILETVPLVLGSVQTSSW